MSSQYKRKIKVVTINDKFFELFNDGSDEEMLHVKKEMHRRPCLIVVKITYKDKKYDFAIPFRSNIHPSAPRNTYYNLPPRKTTKPEHHHGLHYVKAFPIDEKYFMRYAMGGDFREEYVLAYIEKNIKDIINEFQKYINEYENGNRYSFSVDIDNAINKQSL